MKRFIHKDQMNNSIFFVIVELVVLFMFRSDYSQGTAPSIA